MKDTTLDLVDSLIQAIRNGELLNRNDQAYFFTRILDARMIYLANKELNNDTDQDSGQEP